MHIANALEISLDALIPSLYASVSINPYTDFLQELVEMLKAEIKRVDHAIDWSKTE